MTEQEFDNGYWYAVEIKTFANEIGIRSAAKLRKDQLEALIKHFLRTGRVESAPKKSCPDTGMRDVEKGLKPDLPVVNYTNDKETKDFLVKAVLRLAPDMKLKSGARYRLNRWREDQIAQGLKITYADLTRQYVKLNSVEGRFPQAPSGRYLNFMSDFLSHEKNATKSRAIRASKEVKKLDIPKTYRDWKNYHAKQARTSTL
jgi:hypothetical protein